MAKRPKKKKQTREPVLKSPPATARKTRPAPAKPFDWTSLFQALLIVAAGLWIYWPSLHGDWLWDDDTLVSQNALVQDPNGLWYVWFAPSNLIDYFPLTVSLQWLEWQLWPHDTLCYHLTSVILHLCSALLVWHLLSKLGLRLAWLGGLLFAIHPVMVESVAWMAELKNTLSLPPFLLAMCVWVDYERRGKLEYYFTALGLFLIAMLCKTTMVMFPFIIMLYAWWLRGRIGWRDLIKTVPFFAISVAVGLALMAFMRHGVGEETIALGGFLSRLACAGLSIAFYVFTCVLPISLLPMHPQWKINPPSPWQFLPWLVLAGLIYWLWTKRRTWGRHALLGLGFFLINLAPFIGFRTISFMRVTWTMDHIVYLPMIGLVGLAVAALGEADKRLGAPMRPYGIGAVAVVAALLAFGSHRYDRDYVNSEALWRFTILHNPQAWAAYNNLGNALLTAEQLPEAEQQYRSALIINPNYPEALNNLGIVLARTGRLSEAADAFEKALKLCPDLASAQENLAQVTLALKTAPPAK